MRYKLYCPWCGKSITRHVGPYHKLDIDHCGCGGMTSLEWSGGGLEIKSCMGHEKQAKLAGHPGEQEEGDEG